MFGTTIDRRTFLALTLGSTALAALPGFPTSAFASEDDWQQAFEDAFAGDPRLLGWKTPDTDRLETPSLRIEGKLPEDLIGTFYRNGPARHAGKDTSGKIWRYHHWFDSDGMVQAFRFDGKEIRHRGRMVATAKLIAEEEAGKRLYPAFGTMVPDARPVTGPDDLNVANISMLSHAGELLALWEGGSAHRIDADTLETQGLKIWREDLKGVPFTAHPKVEPDGTLWAFGYATITGVLVLYHIGADGVLKRVAAVPVKDLGMVHDFIVTERHLVFVLPPLAYDKTRRATATFLDAHVWKPEIGTRVLVVDKDDFDNRRWIEMPANFNFHFGNAAEDASGIIRFDYCAAPDPTIMTETLRYVMRGEWRKPTGPTRFARVTLDPQAGTAKEEVTETAAEFPRVAPSVVGRAYRYVYTIGGTASGPGKQVGNALVKWDLETGRQQAFVYDPRFLPEEHLFVPRPGGTGEDDGWLVGTALDIMAGATRVSVFDARGVADGPIAAGILPYPLPLGFHGIFVQA